MTLKKTYKTKVVPLQDVIDEYLSGEGLVPADIISAQNEASFLILTTSEGGINSVYYDYMINRKNFFVTHVKPTFIQATVKDVRNISVSGTDLHVFVEFPDLDTI